jgi:hypothetical protein
MDSRLLTATQVRAINSVSRRVSFSQLQLAQYFKGLNSGGNENRLLAAALGATEGVDSLHFLSSLFTPDELTEVKQALSEINPF